MNIFIELLLLFLGIMCFYNLFCHIAPHQDCQLFWMKDFDKRMETMQETLTEIQNDIKDLENNRAIKYTSFPDHPFTAQDLKLFRKTLGLSLRDFASVFGVSFSTMTRIESGQNSGSVTLKYLKLLKEFPDIAIVFVHRKGGKLRPGIKESVLQRLSTMTPGGNNDRR